MNIVFIFILLSSIVFLLFKNPSSILATMLAGGKGALQFGLQLIVIYSIWLSILVILERASIDKQIASLISMPIKKLFKGENDKVYLYLSLNLSCNILGMGGAATPLGIKAIENMTSRKNKTMLVVLNSSSIQLIPTTIIAMRASFASQIDVIIPSLIASIFSTALAIILVLLFVKDKT